MKKIHLIKQSGVLRLLLELPKDRSVEVRDVNEIGETIVKTMKCLGEKKE